MMWDVNLSKMRKAPFLERKTRPVTRKYEETFSSVGRDPEVAPFSHCIGTRRSCWCHLINICNGGNKMANVGFS